MFSDLDSWSEKSSDGVEDDFFEISESEDSSKVSGTGKLRWWSNYILDGSVDLKSLKLSFVQTRSRKGSYAWASCSIEWCI